MPSSVTDTPIHECCMARLVIKNDTEKTCTQAKIGLCSQSVDTILCSVASTFEKA